MKVTVLASFLIFATFIFGQKFENEKFETKPLDSLLNDKALLRNTVQLLQQLTYSGKLGLYIGSCFFTSVRERYPAICDTMQTGLLIPQTEMGYFNVCIGLDANGKNASGEDSLTCLCGIYSPCRHLQFNASDIYKIELKSSFEIDHSGRIITRTPQFIYLYIGKNDLEGDRIGFYVPDLLALTPKEGWSHFMFYPGQ